MVLALCGCVDARKLLIRYHSPPSTVARIMEAAFCILQYPPHEVSTWMLQKRVFIRNNVWDNIINIDPTDSKNASGISQAASILRGYNVDGVNEKASVPVAAMFEWADLMVLMARSAGASATHRQALSQRRKRLQVKANQY